MSAKLIRTLYRICPEGATLWRVDEGEEWERPTWFGFGKPKTHIDWSYVKMCNTMLEAENYIDVQVARRKRSEEERHRAEERKKAIQPRIYP